MTIRTDELKTLTKKFALRIIKVSRALPRCPEPRVIGYQLLRSGTSVAANYRAACRGRSRPEFLAKIGIVVEEADETVFWLEMLTEAGLVRGELLGDIISEANQLVAIFSASQLTVKPGFKIENRQS
jgi:four helix bundle protein